MTNDEWEFYIKKCKVPPKYQPLIRKYRKCFGQHIKEIGLIDPKLITFKVTINRVADSKTGQWKMPHPFYTEPYRQNANNQAEIEKQLDEQLEAGVIEPSRNPGPYQASCTVVLKKQDPITGERPSRVAIDYTGLNANTEGRNYPIPNIHRIVTNTTRFKKFILIDIKSAYNHILVEEESRELLGFAVEGRGRFIPTRMNFGPKGAPAVFGAAMQMVFGDLYPTGWFYQYFDDLTVCGETTEELMERFEQVMKRILKYDLRIKLTKCEFEKETIDLLGSRISNGCLKIQPKNIEAVRKWKLTKENIESFLGTVNYLSKFIPQLAKLAKPIREVHQKKRTLEDILVINSFREIQKIVIQDPELKGIDPQKPVIIRTDASEIAGGAVLLQNDKGKLRPRGYFSTTFTEAERKWKSMVRKEALVMRKAIQHFIRDIKCLKPGWITIQTDSQTLKNMLRKRTQHEDNEVQQAAYEISRIFAEIEHIPGKDNFIADFLSQKKKTQQPDDVERLMVGILDNPDIIG
jgi:hypothetical protein